MLTTHRVVFMKGVEGLEVPLHYVTEFKKGGGLFQTPQVEIKLEPSRGLPPYVVDYYQNVLKRNDLPGPHKLPY